MTKQSEGLSAFVPLHNGTEKDDGPTQRTLKPTMSTMLECSAQV